MQTPNFSQFQFVNASGLNQAFGMVSGSFAQSLSGLNYPGLLHPGDVSMTPTGLTVAIAAPLPFQVLFGGGALSTAFGTVTGAVTSSYSVSFSGLVPASGAAVTAYLLVDHVTIPQLATSIVGPPPGHPDYNPSFVPTTAYLTNVDSLAFLASLTPPDNFTTFEMARCTLASGATGVGTLLTIYQNRSTGFNDSQVVQVSGVVTTAQTPFNGKTLYFTATGSALLPFASGANGITTTIINATSGSVLINAQAGDLLYGASTTVGSGSYTVGPFGNATVRGTNGVWQLIGLSPNLAGGNAFGLAPVGTFSSGTTNMIGGGFYDFDTSAASGAAQYVGSTLAQTTFGVNVSGPYPLTITWTSGMFRQDPTPTIIYAPGIKFFRWIDNTIGFGGP